MTISTSTEAPAPAARRAFLPRDLGPLTIGAPALAWGVLWLVVRPRLPPIAAFSPV
jgi:hypothetical protein